MAKIPNDFDWRKSHAHMDLLKKFLRPKDITELVRDKYLKIYLSETPKIAIERFIRDGVLMDCDLIECLASSFKTTELKEMIGERWLRQTGTKIELAERLVNADRQSIENLIHNRKFMKCSDSGVELIKKHQKENEEAFELAKRKSYEYFLAGKIKNAYNIYITYTRDFISHIKPDSYQFRKLDFILTSHPKVFDSMSPNDLDSLRAAVCMEKLWCCDAELWLPDDFKTPLKSDKISINILKSSAEIRERLDKDSNNEKVRVVFNEYDVDSCEYCLALNGKIIYLNEFPELPFENCTSEVGCQCLFETIDDEEGRFANLITSMITSNNYYDDDAEEEDDTFLKLSQLKKMLENDLITEEEYQKKKKEILSRM